MSISYPFMLPANLKSQLDMARDQGLNQTTMIQHWLHRHEIPFIYSAAKAVLRNALIVGLDAEWYEHDSSYITEVGMSILDPQFISHRRSAWEVLRSSVNHHVRIKPNAHLVNSDLCCGWPEQFQFGKTTFVDTEQAKDMLRHSFLRFDAHGQPRPIVFVGHAVENDVKMLKVRFGLDIEALGVIVATIDTQVLAAENGLIYGPKKGKLSQLLERFGIFEPYLHNGGNDIVCTIVVALLIAFPHPLSLNRTAYNALKIRLQIKRMVLYGNETFCTICDSTQHIAAHCYAIVHCDYCASSPRRSNMANTHKTEKCLEAVKRAANVSRESLKDQAIVFRYPCPCPYCIESLNPERHQLEFAYSHPGTECKYRPAKLEAAGAVPV